MKVVLEKVFPLAASPDSAWQLLQDIETVAGCMPGAKITECVDATHYKGTITVRLGPAKMSFKGDIEVLNLDAAARSLHLVGKGTDATGSSAASTGRRGNVRTDRQERSDHERQSRRARQPADGSCGGPDAQAVRGQLCGAAPGVPGAANGNRRFRERARIRRAASRRCPAFRVERSCAGVGCHARVAARDFFPQVRLSSGAAMVTDRMNDVVSLQQQLERRGFIAERSFAATLLLTMEMRRPLLLEGEAGVGKTEVAKALARLLDTRLIRLQCYEGLDAHSALYEWNYQHQLLAIKLLEKDERSILDKEQDIFSERYLLKRPLLEAITTTPAPVLLIDEIDRTDEAFEAYLLELLSDFQMSIPELGVIRATERPFVILTSNGTREISDALRRRCLYQYIDYPSFEKELLIVRTQIPEVPEKLARQMVEFVQSVRQMDLQKKPGLAETLDWVAALLRLGVSVIDTDGVEQIMDSLSALVKTREDQAGLTRPVVEKLVAAC